ncbi:MAG: methyltransferase domain-containing protein [Euryarchaeota archaeon]|nr:methyltransferase domain-containing protein [Euryarchaeota archaeon]
MPYAIEDRRAFLERVGIGPTMRVLDLETDGVLPGILAGWAEPHPLALSRRPERLRALRLQGNERTGGLAADPSRLPLRTASLDAIVSYHGLHTLPGESLEPLAREAHRALRPDGRFATLLCVPEPRTPAQESGLHLARLLEARGDFQFHDHPPIARALRRAGFQGVTLTVVPRRVPVPDRWLRAHIAWAQEQGREDPALAPRARAYIESAEKVGEEMLPGVQVGGRRIVG